jgi:hypothetical protein
MRIREAKDFLVQHAVEQAAIENVRLSDLEKRMMYFTESDDRTEDPAKLDEEFSAIYDSEEFEARTAGLLHRAYRRLLKVDKNKARAWHNAIRQLRKGDHYIVVLWDIGPRERPPGDSLKLLGAAVLVVIVGVALFAGFDILAGRFNLHWRTDLAIQRTVPTWMQRSLISLMIAGYLYYVAPPWLLRIPISRIARRLIEIVGVSLGILKTK